MHVLLMGPLSNARVACGVPVLFLVVVCPQPNPVPFVCVQASVGCALGCLILSSLHVDYQLVPVAAFGALRQQW